MWTRKSARGGSLRHSHKLQRSQADYSQLEPRNLLANFTVTSLQDGNIAGTLRYCIYQAGLNNEADTINFASNLAQQTIVIGSTQDYLPAVPELPIVGTGLIINKDTITIDGANAPRLSISGNNQYRIFGVTGTGHLTLRNITLEVGRVEGRYVRLTARNIGRCPSWHPGAGGKAWIFTDEILVE